MRRFLATLARRAPLRLLSAFALVGCMVRPAAAYTDPGSGLLLWQALGAFLAGGVFYFRSRLAALLRILGLHRPAPDEPHKRS
jgi:hypothetical protein